MDDVVLLSRIQFALTIMFHYIFPPLTIGMGIVLVYLEAMYLKTGLIIYETAVKFWVRLFAVSFAVGVATGIVMEFQFGTNWAVYSRFVGDVFGSALAAEGIFAFFLESGFLAVLVFGWDKVSKPMHFFSTCMVFLGSIFSSIWIVVANSWQQTPAGHHIVPVEGAAGVAMRAEIVDFWAMVLNPSTVHRLVHVWIGCFIVGAFFIMSVSAWYILKNRHLDFAKRSFSGALIFGLLFSLLAPLQGHFQAQNVYRHQPAKLAAFEGHYTTGTGNLSLFGIPNDADQRLDYEFSIPGALSFLQFGDFKSPVIGLDKFRPQDRPPVAIPFFSYHIMVTLGSLFIALTVLAAFLRLRGTLFQHRWLMWIFVFAVVGPFIANELGWVAAEVGRQPWSVQPPLLIDPVTHDYAVNPADGRFIYDESQGLRTSDAVSPAINADQVLGSIIGFGLIYILLGLVWVFVLNHKIQQGPQPVEPPTSKPQHPFLDTAAQVTDHKKSYTQPHAPDARQT